MAKIERDNFDLPTLGMKNNLVGTELALDDGTFLEIADWWLDSNTIEMHLTFIDGTTGVFNGRDKYTIKVTDTYKKVDKGDRKKKQKRKH